MNDMQNKTTISLRVSYQAKKRLKAAARREKMSVKEFLQDRVPELRERKHGRRHRPTEEARAALERFIGCVESRKSSKLTNEEIDRIVYGGPGCQSLQRFRSVRRGMPDQRKGG